MQIFNQKILWMRKIKYVPGFVENWDFEDQILYFHKDNIIPTSRKYSQRLNCGKSAKCPPLSHVPYYDATSDTDVYM